MQMVLAQIFRVPSRWLCLTTLFVIFFQFPEKPKAAKTEDGILA